MEKELRESAQLRRLHDELRALHFTLQAMPTSEPSEDLVERVLRQAERRLLLGDEQTGDRAGESASPPARTAVVTSAVPARRNWRLVAGVVATVAALLLAILWLPQVAQLPTADVALHAPQSQATRDALEAGGAAKVELADGAFRCFACQGNRIAADARPGRVRRTRGESCGRDPDATGFSGWVTRREAESLCGLASPGSGAVGKSRDRQRRSEERNGGDRG